eukprot:TRINITY_DN20449_c0_g1_i1.p1 TRINITY_DN20449_c0_g1~~TRINITY_DN20449_c0_g1_i1.p1  ORF type:complete len:160 (+),score=18.43 TRINITY_DN20449_c0_g1_i1:60-482(+)
MCIRDRSPSLLSIIGMLKVWHVVLPQTKIPLCDSQFFVCSPHLVKFYRDTFIVCQSCASVLKRGSQWGLFWTNFSKHIKSWKVQNLVIADSDSNNQRDACFFQKHLDFSPWQVWLFSANRIFVKRELLSISFLWHKCVIV